MLAFAVIFFAAYFLVNLRRVGPRAILVRTFWCGIGGAILFLPWVFHIFAGEYVQIFSNQLTTPPSQTSTFTQDYNAIGDLYTYLPRLVWVLLLAAIAWGLWRKEREALLVGLWWLLILLAANPQWLRLPGAGALTSFAVLIAAYIPAAVLIGAACGWALDDLQAAVQARSAPPALVGITGAVLTFLLIAFGLWGAPRQLRLVDPQQFSLATRPDLRAMQWIRQTPLREPAFW